MKKLMTILAITCLSMVSLLGCSNTSSNEETKATTAATATPAPVMLTGKHHVEIEVDTLGTIKVELNADIAPITVTNFITLANNKFYDGLTFHRVINKFMIQGGDPLGNGTGGSENTIKGEFKSNGIANSISHVRGTISMARSAQSYDSASSQFFICQENAVYLDGEYAAFGTVTEGMAVVDQIAAKTKVQDKNGTVAKENQPVIETIKVID
ncbi:MAG: peptidylprolyl isomerase [bacterium]|nr:peptidylprolyl isomerase [bacterium]